MSAQEQTVSTHSEGFTLVELMIVLLISGLIFSAVFSVYSYQQRHYTAQLDVTEMQQNLRSGLNYITRDIRMAGFDKPDSGVAQIIQAEPDLFYFTVDLNEDGDVADAGEHIAYDQYDDGGNPTLGRKTGSAAIVTAQTAGRWTATGHQPAAENIEHLRFQYLDADGHVTSAEDKIRTVVVTIVARAPQPDPKFQNIQTYTAADGTNWTKNDNYRRQMQIMTVQCRNIGT